MQMALHKNNVFRFKATDSKMELQRQRQYLTITTACLLTLSAAVIYWSVSPIGETGPKLATVQSKQMSESATPEKGAFRIPVAMAERQLRAPLYDPEPPPPAPPKPIFSPAPRSKPTLKLNLTLVGTIIDPGNSLAIIADANGQFDVKGVGDTLEIDPDGIEISNIKAEQVTLTHRGKSTVLILERTQKKIKGSSGNRNNRKRGLK